MRTRVDNVEGMTKPDSDSRIVLPILLLFSLNLSVCVSELQVAIIARSSRDMSQTVLKKKIFNQSILPHLPRDPF